MSMAYGLEGELVRLVAMDLDRHLETYLAWLNDTEITDGLLMGCYPQSRQAQRDFMTNHRDGPKGIIFAIETLDGQHIGGSGIHDIDHLNQTCTTGSFIGNTEFQGKGYGTDAARVRSKYCFETLNMRYVYSAYLEGNIRSAKMQTKIGAKESGRYPKRYLKHGEFKDEIIMSLSREDWELNRPQ